MNKKIGAEILRFDELPSTNNYAKEKRAEGKDLVVIAKKQSGGRGTKGRSFVSEEGGVYLSKLTFYADFLASEAFQIMATAAVSVCETLEYFGLNPVIKWANDVYVSDKKICGILIENVFSGNTIRSSVVGIGLNVCNRLPAELETIATTMERETGKRFSVEEVTNRLVENLEKKKTMKQYLSYLGYMGRQAELILGDERVHGRLVSVDERGALTVEIDGKMKILTAAEVSVRL
ncbi:MAG: biotin--[Clostridia bacterium]|nr:biotin--[acetyl-CoA-carboxylase] ligase [Clostridia bacterium]